MACVSGMPCFPVLSTLRGGYFSRFSAHLLAAVLGNLVNTALNLATSGKFDVCTHGAVRILLKLVKNDGFPTILAAMLHSVLGFNVNLRPDLFAKAGLSNFVARLVASNAVQVAMMLSIGTLINAVFGLINTSISGVAKLGAHASLIAKIGTIQTFPLALVVAPVLLGLCHQLSASTTLFSLVMNSALFIFDKFNISGKIGHFPLRAFQGILTIAEIPFRLDYSLLHAKNFREAVEVIKSELLSIPRNKFKILQRPQIQFQG
jgi:hypothetical protein